jgi:general secretion pathway protein K
MNARYATQLTTLRSRQRGLAVVVAVLVVALATSTVSFVLWHQSLWLRQVENLTERAQADAIGRAAANWAAAILAEDNRAIDHLGEAWAQPIPSFAAEAAQVSGAITDEQSKFNINSLVRDGAASAPDVVVYQRLLEALGLPGSLADTLVDWLDADDTVTQPNGAEDSYYLALDPPYRAGNQRVVDVTELARVKGYTPAVIARLAPYITALPTESLVNVNTAPAPVLQAVVPTLSGGADAAQIIDRRKDHPYESVADFVRALTKQPQAPLDSQIDIKSRYFSADLTVRLGRVTVGYHALFERPDQGSPSLIALSQIAY